MKVYSEMSIVNFEAWSGAVDTKKRVIECGKVEEFNSLIEELYPDGLSATELNDLLWFEPEWVYENLGIEESDEEEDEE